jgi:TetR/AcrR family tetracycline transcriptional repressor
MTAARGTLTRERILATALRLVDEGGMAALSMRRLGTELGVDPMAVYRHLANKRALVLGLAEQLFAGLGAAPEGEPWEQRVRAWARAYRDLGMAHPALVLHIVTDPEAVAVAAGHANIALRAALEDAGLPAADVVRGAAVVADYVNGYVLGAAAAVSAGLAVTGGAEDDDSFGFGLDLLLAGVAAQSRPHNGERNTP